MRLPKPTLLRLFAISSTQCHWTFSRRSPTRRMPRSTTRQWLAIFMWWTRPQQISTLISLSKLKISCSESTKVKKGVKAWLRLSNASIEFYSDKKNDSEFSPKKIDKDTQLAADDTTRAIVNSFIQLSNTMPKIKSEAAECNQQVEALISQNQQTMAQIGKASADLVL